VSFHGKHQVVWVSPHIEPWCPCGRHLEVDGRHVSELPGQREALERHVLPPAGVHVRLHEHAVHLLGLEHLHQRAPEQLRNLTFK